MSVSAADDHVPKCAHCKTQLPCYDRGIVNSLIEKYSSDPANKTKTEQTICFKCGSVYKRTTVEELLAEGQRDMEKAFSRFIKVPYIHSEGYMWVKKEVYPAVGSELTCCNLSEK